MPIPPVDYLLLRLVRHHLPDWLAHGLLRRRWIIRPGMETRDPAAGFRLFRDAIVSAGGAIGGHRIMIFGYGGRTAVGLELLRVGAEQVILLDPYARAVEARSDERLTLVHQPLKDYLEAGGQPVDLVLSNSVLEHVTDLADTVRDLARVTRTGGRHFHFVDLRDHFFKYPFEMLCHSEPTWRRFLNPGSNLNRLRGWDYERLFTSAFRQVDIDVRVSDLAAFRAARFRIRREFLSGDESRDAVTQILIRASLPER